MGLSGLYPGRMDFAPGMIFRHPTDGHLMFVRRESRKGVEGIFLIGTWSKRVFERWIPEADAEQLGEMLVADPGARAEVAIFIALTKRTERERDVYKKAYRRAVRMVTNPKQKRELRDYVKSST